MNPEEKARQQIDATLTQCGWTVQDYKALDLSASRGVALREVPLKSGRCDYLLLVDRKPCGIVEAKPEGTTLSGVADQSAYYGDNLPDIFQTVGRLPFLYESTGVETYFRDERDPHPRSRRVFAFHRPETLRLWMKDEHTLRFRLAQMGFKHPLVTVGMRDCQIEAVTQLEQSFAHAHPRALIQMATGAGKTFTACAFIYRLIKFAGARRVLFLVDRANLGRQATSEFHQFVTPDTGRKFTELYNVQHLQSNAVDDVSRVTICTIQRLYSMLRGEELDEEIEEHSTWEISAADKRPKEVAYNPQIPVEAFDFIVTDECHRSIYNLWRQVLEYFDSFLVGLTATPSMQTIGFFNSNLVTEYNHERAVADGVNVGYEVYRIKTDVTERGGKVEKGFYVDKRSKETRKRRWEQLDNDLEYLPQQLDRSVVVPSQIRTVLEAFKDALESKLFPGRDMVPKTLIFAKDDSHAEDIVHIVREVFGRGNDFAKKITYQAKERRNRQSRQRRRTDSTVSHFAATAHRRHGGYDRHRHRHQAARMLAVSARCAQPRVLRADERTRHASSHAHRFAGGERRRCARQNALCDRGCRWCLRKRQG
jgi:type I restriction enzyme R subunit